MEKISSQIYQSIFRKNSIFIGTIFASAFVFKIAFDQGTQAIWDYVNQNKQWKDIRKHYLEE
ncbi:unnamed protein product [Pneumocystis jirovecii]|uniref:Complex III subunit 9 n=2 Tax=Pneumocystis jirovecii TaxID=42068 RepID=L0PAH6_PNEJI|nr:uncharacterized protein T551_02932 [Pneumocystis jirovecii RU7]KTW27965.1 hypothetical protein T551_02932 [Pneumocystis jirovecii RU7]CCJ29376.1 unnamed protein product [Pneumocystis jirovecii]